MQYGKNKKQSTQRRHCWLEMLQLVVVGAKVLQLGHLMETEEVWPRTFGGGVYSSFKIGGGA